MTKRPSVDAYFLALASLLATRSTCCRRSVGCILVDERNHVLATGYNGVAAGEPHCNFAVENPPMYKEKDAAGNSEKVVTFSYPNACPGYDAPSGTNLDGCHAIHAEENALVQCRDAYAIHTVYCTTEPCVRCTRMLKQTGARRVVALETYAGSGRAQWKGDGREWCVPGWVDHEASLTALRVAVETVHRVQKDGLGRTAGVGGETGGEPR